MEKTYMNLWNMLEKEVNNIEQAKSLDKNSFELLYYVTGAMDHLCSVMNNKEDDGMSGRMPYYYDGNRYMDGGMSGARRRDSMGRYMDGYPDNGYSRDNSRKRMVQKLETLMDDTMSDHERQAIQDCINKIQ